MASKKKNPTTKVEVTYTITHRMVIEVEPSDVDHAIEITGLTLASHGKNNYEKDENKSIRDTKIDYRYLRSGTIR